MIVANNEWLRGADLAARLCSLCRDVRSGVAERVIHRTHQVQNVGTAAEESTVADLNGQDIEPATQSENQSDTKEESSTL